MTYFATCTFDLKNASHDDYKAAYADLKNIGLFHAVVSSDGKEVVLPTTMTAGQFDAGSAGGLRDQLTEQIKLAFSQRGFRSEIFITIGGDWAWAHRVT